MDPQPFDPSRLSDDELREAIADHRHALRTHIERVIERGGPADNADVRTISNHAVVVDRLLLELRSRTVHAG